MIDGVLISPRRVIKDDRGDILHMLRSTDVEFRQFGEMYFSKVEVGKKKTWRRHREATSQLTVPVGSVHFILFDDRVTSSTHGTRLDATIGESNHHLITIPPMVWYAFENAGSLTALIGNCSSHPRDPSESDRRDLHDSRMPKL
jgi:dTDP-4-dehydrorhamnose 3,5-epimerase